MWMFQVPFGGKAESFQNNSREWLWAGRSYAKPTCRHDAWEINELEHGHKNHPCFSFGYMPDMWISCCAYWEELGPCRREIRRQRHDRSGDQVQYVAATATATASKDQGDDDGLKDVRAICPSLRF